MRAEGPQRSGAAVLKGCELTQTRQEQRLSVAVNNPAIHGNLQALLADVQER
jgi:hypothetical protein